MEYMVLKFKICSIGNLEKCACTCLHFSLHSNKVLTEETRKRSMHTHRFKTKHNSFALFLVYEKRFINIHTHQHYYREQYVRDEKKYIL